MNPDPEKGIECYVDADFAGRWNQEEGKDPVLVLSITEYVIIYSNCPIIWASRIQTKIELKKIEVEYIALYQAMRYVLPFVSLMKETEFIIKLQGDAPTLLCSLFEKLVTPITVYEENQVATELAVSPQIWTCTKHIDIKYNQLQIFVANGDQKNVNIKEQITDIFKNPLDSELFGYLRYKLNSR